MAGEGTANLRIVRGAYRMLHGEPDIGGRGGGVRV